MKMVEGVRAAVLMLERFRRCSSLSLGARFAGARV